MLFKQNVFLLLSCSNVLNVFHFTELENPVGFLLEARSNCKVSLKTIYKCFAIYHGNINGNRVNGKRFSHSYRDKR